MKMTKLLIPAAIALLTLFVAAGCGDNTVEGCLNKANEYATGGDWKRALKYTRKARSLLRKMSPLWFSVPLPPKRQVSAIWRSVPPPRRSAAILTAFPRNIRSGGSSPRIRPDMPKR